MHTMESHVSAPVFGTGSQFILMEVNSVGGKGRNLTDGAWMRMEGNNVFSEPKGVFTHPAVLFIRGKSTSQINWMVS